MVQSNDFFLFLAEQPFSAASNLENLPISSKKAGRFEKLLGLARSHSIVTRGSVSLSCATTLHPSCFSKF